MKSLLLGIVALLLSSLLSFGAGYWWHSHQGAAGGLFDPLPQFANRPAPTPTEAPLQKYAIPRLAERVATEASTVNDNQPLQITRLLQQDPETKLYTLLFTYHSRGQQISGALTIQLDPATTSSSTTLPIIIMLRGFAPQEGYYSGMGSKNAAAVFAQQGYATLAPDFLGYGDSDPDLEDSWEARFVKPLQVVDLLRTLAQHPQLDLSQLADPPTPSIQLDSSRLGIWAHSNGGQIAVTTLQILGHNLPTTLWAPVLAPFPYSILYFTDENADEGKAARKWLSMFETDYDVFDFSLTQHLDRLQGPLQIHHGERDDAALASWSREFVDKVKVENQRRAQLTEADPPAAIEVSLHLYPNANHNLQPNWQQAIERDVIFFDKWVKNQKK